jgi:hypothetical protein
VQEHRGERRELSESRFNAPAVLPLFRKRATGYLKIRLKGYSGFQLVKNPVLIILTLGHLEDPVFIGCVRVQFRVIGLSGKPVREPVGGADKSALTGISTGVMR